MLISRRVCIRRCMVRLRIKGIELSSRIEAVIENNAWRKCMYVVHQRSVVVLNVAVRRTRVHDVSSLSSRGYRKSIPAWILGDSRGWQRIAFLTHRKSGNAEWKSVTKTRDAIRLARMWDVSLLNDYANIIEDANRIVRKRNRFVYEQSKIDSTAELVTSQRDPRW